MRRALESLVKKFAANASNRGSCKNRYPQRGSITDYVFRWLGCQFIRATGSDLARRSHPEEPLKNRHGKSR